MAVNDELGELQRALEAADAGAACLRINPGNIGSGQRVAEVVRAAKANGCAIRIGVNAGSLEKDLLEKYIGRMLPDNLKFKTFLSEDGSGKGAALIAAIATHRHNNQ